jgi:DNA-binding response OmpR family regulator
VAGELVLVIDDSPTILKVVQLVLTKAGFSVDTATDGEEGIAHAARKRPDLILLDFVMPKMNGYQVCRALAESAALKDIPVVLMSAKGDQVGERFVKVMGIVDYVTKPFSPDAITAVVQHTIEKYARRALDGDGGDRGGGETTSDTTSDTTSETTGETTLEGKRMLPTLRQPAPSVDAMASAGETGPALQGNLRAVPLAEVLGLLAAQRQWGILAVTRADGGGVDVCFKAGRIELALAHGLGEEFLLGRYLVEVSTMSRQDLDLFLEGRQPQSRTGKPIGQQLVKMNYVNDGEVKEALVRQTQERIFELLRWPSGKFSFTVTRDLPQLAGDAALGLDIDGILMEGVRRVDEWHLIEREIDDFDAVFLRNEEAVQNVGRARLTREELAVLELVNGKHTVKDIVRQSRMGSFDVSKMLFRLLSIKVIRRRVAPVAV